jgi:hypothetical protein
MPRHKKPRTSRRRMQGQRILNLVPTHQIIGNGVIGVTAARKFVSGNRICCPAIIHVRRNDYTVDSFFLAEKGMFSLSYTEFNWVLFPCLKDLIEKNGPEKLFADLDQYDWASEEENYRTEYAFI